MHFYIEQDYELSLGKTPLISQSHTVINRPIHNIACALSVKAFMMQLIDLYTYILSCIHFTVKEL